MAISGREFKITYDDGFPTFKIDINVKSLNPKITDEFKSIAIIDTGADLTLIRNPIIRKLGLLQTNERELLDFQGNLFAVKFYSARIIIDNIMDEICEVGGTDHDALIGMDLIMKWHILINSPNDKFEIVNNANYKLTLP